MIASRIQQHFQEFQDTKNEPDVKGFFALFKKVDAATRTVLHVKELLSAVAPLLPAIPTAVQHLLQ